MKRFRLSALSLRWTLLSIEWTLLLGGMISALIGPYFRDHPDRLPAYLAYCASFFVLSAFLPIDRPLWERRVYIALEVLLIVSALWVQLWFDVLLYLILVKSCFLFSRRDVLITVVLAGATYLPSSFLGFSQRINELLYKLSTQGP